MKSAIVVALLVRVAHADAPLDRPAAIEVDREDAPAGRVELGFDGGAPLEAGWGISLGAGILTRPISLSAPGSTANPVRRRETLVLGGAFAVTDRAVVDVRMPLSHQVGDRLVIAGDDGALDRWVAGDLRIAARVRIAGTAARAVFLRGALTLPTGNDNEFAGDAKWGLQWNLIGRATFGDVIVAATAGIRIRGAEVTIGDRVVGDELAGALGVVVPIPPFAWCNPAGVALTAELAGVLGDDINGVRGPSPVELRGGIVTQPWPGLHVGLRAGVGLDDQIGAPAWRAMLELSWSGAWKLFDDAPAAGPAAELDDPAPE